LDGHADWEADLLLVAVNEAKEAKEETGIADVHPVNTYARYGSSL